MAATLTLSLSQLRIIDAALCFVADYADNAVTATPTPAAGAASMALREALTAPAINVLNPGEIDM